MHQKKLIVTNAKKKKLFDLILIVICAAIVLGFGVSIYILPQSEFSAEENRTLQTLPNFSWSSIKSGAFTRRISNFYADQFPYRNSFVGAKALVELGLIKCENNGVLLGKNGYLIKRLEYSDYNYLKKNLESVYDFSKNIGIPTVFAIAPRAIDVMKSQLPIQYDTQRADYVWNIVDSSDVDYIGFSDILTEYERIGKKIWYRTDHHWTTLGAYYSYAELSKSLGYSPVQISKFKIETVSDSFLGTTYSASGIKGIAPDTIDFFRYEGDENFVIKDSQGNNSNGFYTFSYLDEKDKYAAFLGGNSDYIKIYKPQAEDRERLLIIKDSFANSVIPFLANHYDIDVVDLRFYNGSVYDLANEIQADKILILYGIDSLATSDTLTLLNYGK